jgi:hypothetical protein
MNIALSAVIISILLIPPVVFYLSLYIGRYPRAIPKFSLFEGILACAVVSLLIHAIAITFIGAEIRFDILMKVLGGDLKDVESTVKNPELKAAVTDFATYNAVLLFTMIVLGRLVRLLLLRTGLHSRNEIFALYNKWWYFFNGNFADIENHDLVFIDATLDTKDGTVIYSGFLSSFETRGGELDRIYLRDTVRREFKKYAADHPNQLVNETGDPIPVPGGTFLLKYASVLTLNANFIVIQETTASVEAPDL